MSLVLTMSNTTQASLFQWLQDTAQSQESLARLAALPIVAIDTTLEIVKRPLAIIEHIARAALSLIAYVVRIPHHCSTIENLRALCRQLAYLPASLAIPFLAPGSLFRAIYYPQSAIPLDYHPKHDEDLSTGSDDDVSSNSGINARNVSDSPSPLIRSASAPPTIRGK